MPGPLRRPTAPDSLAPPTLRRARHAIRAPRHLARGLLALVIGVVLVLATGGFVFAEAAAAPPPDTVLSGARSFVGRAGSWSYTATVQVSVPSAAGSALVVTHQVTGTDLVARATDFDTTVGPTSTEYLAVKAAPGVWVRTGATTTLTSLGWVHAPSYTDYESSLLAARSATGTADPSAVAGAILADLVSSGDIIPALVAAARDPHRQSSSVRSLSVRFDPHTALGSLAGLVNDVFGEVIVDSSDHPTQLLLQIAAATGTNVLAHYTVTWGTPVTISPPAAADVVSEVSAPS